MPVPPTWNEQEQPVLEAIFGGEEAGALLDMEGVADATGLELPKVARALKNLHEAGFVAGVDVTAFGEALPIRFIDLELRERGRRAIGQWPEGAAEAFVTALNRLIAVEDDPDQRSRLAKVRDAAGDVSKSVLTGAILAGAQAVLH